jgi:uncharacterized membrane protein YkvA (DUF1232 family)
MWKFFKENFVLIFVVLYVLSPIDLIPEAVIPILGYLDDLGIIGIAMLKQYSDYRKGKFDPNKVAQDIMKDEVEKRTSEVKEEVKEVEAKKIS